MRGIRQLQEPIACSAKLESFREVWLLDFEFMALTGERPLPHCMVARELRSGRTLRIWLGAAEVLGGPVFDIDDEVLFVAYFSSAEWGCFLAMGWPLPRRVLDLYVEFKCIVSGGQVPCGYGLLGAMSYYGLDGIEAAEKSEMRELAMRGGPYADVEQAALLDYCETDVVALARLLPVMLSEIDLPRALLRGRYMVAVARMEWAGIPIDAASLANLRSNWSQIQSELILRIGSSYQLSDGSGIYDGQTFKTERFTEWLAENEIPWPRLPTGRLSLDDDAFRQMCRLYPVLSPLRELRHTLGGLRLESLAVGNDGRNRCLISPFASKTSRNQPSNSKFAFGPSVWLRGLIQPNVAQAIAYIDYEQQEFGIAAALSGDQAMMKAYSTGDPYLEFAKQAGAVPPTATKASHKNEREQFKVCALAVQYGMASQSLAASLNVCEARARELLELHRRTYPRFWQWSQAVVDHAMLRGFLHTVFGWRIHVDLEPNPRSLANFPMQANGAEMLRLACCLTTEQGITVCAPVHDALLIEAHEDLIDVTVLRCQAAMREASETVLSGFPLRTDTKIVRYPDRYMDPRGERMWREVWSLLGTTPDSATCITGVTPSCTADNTPVQSTLNLL